MTEELKTTVTIFNKDGKPVEADIEQLDCALKSGYTKIAPKFEEEPEAKIQSKSTRAPKARL